METWDGAKPVIEAGLWYRYGRQKRPEVTALTTFDAVLRGERSSTTRFLKRPGHEAWARVAPGDLVRCWEDKEHTGRSLVVRITSVQPIDLWTCSAAELEAWSLREGWLPERGRALGGELGAALWLHHELVWPSGEAPPAQMSLF